MRLIRGSAGRPSLPGITILGFAPAALPAARTSLMVISLQPGGRSACISAKPPEAVTSSVEL